MKELKSSPSVKSVNMDEYDALYIPGKREVLTTGIDSLPRSWESFCRAKDFRFNPVYAMWQ